MKTSVLWYCLLAVALMGGRAVAKAPAFNGLDGGCLETELRDCRILSAGFMAADGDGARYIAWQTQAGFTYENGVRGGFVLFQHDGTRWSLLDKGFEAWRYASPVTNELGLVHVAGYGGGTAAANADRLYRWEMDGEAGNGRWQTIIMDGWQETVLARLPEGLAIEKGVSYGFREPWSDISALTALWRRDDANCCPTGGDAEIVFDIEDARLVVTAIRILPPFVQ